MKPVQANEDTHGMQTLTPNEIAAVAGGPEATVGTGLNPTVAASNQTVPGVRVLSTAEIYAVAGGPESEVATA